METKGGQLNYNAELILYFQRNLEAGYASLYQKMKTKDPSEHPWYKVYNLDDYKKMQREVRLNRGTLGPDLDTESYKDKVGFCIQTMYLIALVLYKRCFTLVTYLQLHF